MADKEYQRYGVYFDAKMEADQEIVAQELRKIGVKANRSAVVRYVLNKVAREIEEQGKVPRK